MAQIRVLFQVWTPSLPDFLRGKLNEDFPKYYVYCWVVFIVDTDEMRDEEGGKDTRELGLSQSLLSSLSGL